MPRRPTIARSRRFSTRLLGLALTALVLLLYNTGNPLLDVLELKTYDMRLLRLAPQPPDDRIVIAAVDEKSLAAFGRWPWNRDTQARIFERLDQLGAHVIASDVFFSEAAPGDERLQAAIAKNRRTVLAMTFLSEDADVRHVSAEQAKRELATVEPQAIAIVRHHGDTPMSARFEEPKGLLVNLPRIQAAAKYTGHINIHPDSDGAMRWASLVLPYRDHYFPSADVQAVRAYSGGPALTLRTNAEGIEALEIGERLINTDEQGRVLIRYYGPEQTFTTFSIADLLNRKFDATLVKDRIVLIGTTVKGIGDIRTTPYGPAFPGVEVRATIMQNILRGDFISRPGWMIGVDMMLLLCVGVTLSFVLPRLRVAAAAAVVTVVFGAYLGGGFYLFETQRVWLNLTSPTLLLVLLFMSTTVVQYFLTESERRQIKSAFQHYLHPKLVDEVIRDIDQLKLGGAKRELTVLFSDIRGFTTTTETLAPEELVRLLNQYLTRMTEQVFRHDGMLDKYIGDAIMAVYGAPIHRPDHAVLACQTALDMMRELRTLRQQWQREKKPAFDIGIGINTGQMIVGNMGSENRFNYTVIGDAVNIGSRIESLNKVYGTHILLSEFTYAQVHNTFKDIRKVDVTQIRGRETPVGIYELIPEGEYRNLNWLDDFEQARVHFHAGRVAKAKPIFERLVKSVNDPVSRYYLARGRVQARKQT